MVRSICATVACALSALTVSACIGGDTGGGAGAGSFNLPSNTGTGGNSNGRLPNLGAVDIKNGGGLDASDGSGSGESSDAVGSGLDAGTAPPTDLPPKADTSNLPKTDKDNDGVTPADGDCDDNDKAIFPGASEWCNDKDDDCNGMIDDFDGDKDGFAKCPGAGQDCDDDDPDIYPGAKSACAPGKDGDCDGVPDLEVDNDGDGHPICGDCDDNDPAVHPGATPDCNSKKDKNCDGTPDNQSDKDKDGDPSCTDCNDNDPKVFKAALEVCDKIDQDCNGLVDDLDYDGDGYFACMDDCNDKDITINPGAGRNCKNNKDNDCNGKIDAQEDGDKDGFVGCQDCNDYNAMTNPGSIEMPGDSLDNDCDGVTDELGDTCDKVGLNAANATDFASAIDLCTGMQQSTFVTVASANAKAIKQAYGAPKPIKGPNMVAMSSGVAAAKGQPGFAGVSTPFSNSAPYPPVSCKNSGAVYDYTEWKLTIKVPQNAQAFAFDFNFMSHEYPVYVGTQFNDKFLAIVDSQGFKGNASFDSKGNCISINNALFQECDANAPNKKSTCTLGMAGLVGTGYDDVKGGGTGWLTTTVPVKPGETVTVRFIIFDEGDHILDSAVLIDNFRWLAKSAGNTPSTVRPGSG